MGAAGLLFGLEKPQEAEYYSQSKSNKSAAALIKLEQVQLPLFCSKAKTESKLKKIVLKASGFVCSSQLWDRTKLLKQLIFVLNGNGPFVCVLVEKSSGKSFLFKTLTNQDKKNDISLDMRPHHSGILSGLLGALKANPILRTSILTPDFLKMIGYAADVAGVVGDASSGITLFSLAGQAAKS